MKCLICKQAETYPGVTTVTLERNGLTLVLKDVPAQVCPNCGEVYADEDATAELLESAEEMAQIGTLKQNLDDPQFPKIAYRRGASGMPIPMIQGTGVRVQTIVIAKQVWELTVEEIATEYELPTASVHQALDFYQSYQEEIDKAIAAEDNLETQNF